MEITVYSSFTCTLGVCTGAASLMAEIPSVDKALEENLRAYTLRMGFSKGLEETGHPIPLGPLKFPAQIFSRSYLCGSIN